MGIRILERFQALQQSVKIPLRLLVSVAVSQFLLVECEIIGRIAFIYQRFAGKCLHDILEEHALRQTVVHQMMEILKQIDLFPPTIDLQSVQVVLERIERAHTFLEECCVGFASKCGDTNNGWFPITAHLHHVSVTSHKARLYVAVRINHFAKCCS